MCPENGEECKKYQKINGENAKLKSQIIVIKNSFQEEQAKCNSLQDQLKEKENVTKKLNRELESLSFQNKQLTKKVTILQEDLAQANSGIPKSKSGKNSEGNPLNSPTFTIEEFSVLDCELQSKIRENARLHLDYEQQKQESNQIIRSLSDKLDGVKTDCDTKLKDMKELLEDEILKNSRLSQDKNRLEAKLLEYLAEMQQSKSQSIVIPNKNISDTSDGFSKQQFLDFLNKYEEAENRASLYKVESRMLENRLEVLEQELKISYKTNQELKTSVKNYESQLSVMSEYITTLDDKIVKQRDEIEILKTMKLAKAK